VTGAGSGRRVATAVALALLGAACRRNAPEQADAAPAPTSVASASPRPAGLSALAPAIATADLRVEARRGTLPGPDPLTERHRAALEAHFGGPVPYPLAFQVATISPDRAAVLLQATRGEARPIVWLLDASGAIVWAKEHPIGGVKPGVSEAVIAPGPDGHVCLAWCNAATDSIALRRWAEDGGAFADYDAVHVDACDALSVLYWPRRGWVLAAAFPGGATLELVNENGSRVWGNDGLALPWTWRGAAPVSLALDTLDSLLLFRLGQSGGAGSGEYVFATRWSPDGRPMWPGPLSLKRLPAPIADPLVRVVLTPGAEGTIRATLPGGALSIGDVDVEVASDGAVSRH
jgi:hypothetical protein